jgi:phage tail tube protein FII
LPDDSAFKDLKGAFDLPDIMDDPDPQPDPVSTNLINNNAVAKSSPATSPLKDEEYLRTTSMQLIETTMRMLQRLEGELKTGSAARDYEVFGQIADTVNRQIAELGNLNEKVEKAKAKRKELKLKEKTVTLDTFKTTDKIALTASQLNDMLNDAASRSELKSIDANFKIESYKDHEGMDK